MKANNKRKSHNLLISKEKNKRKSVGHVAIPLKASFLSLANAFKGIATWGSSQ